MCAEYGVARRVQVWYRGAYRLYCAMERISYHCAYASGCALIHIVLFGNARCADAQMIGTGTVPDARWDRSAYIGAAGARGLL